MDFTLNSPYEKVSFTSERPNGRKFKATFESIPFLVKRKAYTPKKKRTKFDTRPFTRESELN